MAFAFQNTPKRNLELPGLAVTPFQMHNGTAKFDLTLILEESPNGLVGSVEYSTDLFDVSTITGMAEQFVVLLEAIVADPDRRIDDLPLLGGAERERILQDWNDTQSAYPRDSCVHELVESQVERTPDSTAVTAGDEQLTYRELNKRANQLAEYLRSLGVGPETFVGLYMEPSPNLIVAMLGILKAGGAYVPLNPTDPAERAAFMLEDTQAPVVVAEKRLFDQVPWQIPNWVWIDSDGDAIARMDHDNVQSGATADSLAYAMYTSGSTGKPKGVLVPHRAIARLVCAPDYVELRPSDRVAQASNPTFDAATFEVWGALINGARLVMIPQDVLLSPLSFAREIRERGITVLFLTTSLFHQLARDVPDAFGPIRFLLIGGEVIDPVWVRRVLDIGPPGRLIHVYGPTEGTTFSTWHFVDRVATGSRTIPIGRPVANSRVYVLDGNLVPVPIGIPGEIYVGGDGLARGYLNRPDFTAERFVSDPFSADPAARMYKPESTDGQGWTA